MEFEMRLRARFSNLPITNFKDENSMGANDVARVAQVIDFRRS
jgi:hypothetical protein